MWQARNSEVLLWERDRDVTQSKAEVKRGIWTKPEPTGRKRGRPPKAEHDLAESTLQTKLRRQESEAAAQVDLQPSQTRQQVRAKMKKERLNAKGLRAAGGFDSVATVGWQGVGGGLMDPLHIRPRQRVARRSEPALRAQQLGIGSVISVYWKPPTECRRGKYWRGTVTALVPVQEGIVEQVVQYETERRRYRHDLGAGKTKFRVQMIAMRREDDSCQQGNMSCHCSSHCQHMHAHPWYEGNSRVRADCECFFCESEEQVDVGIPAMDYQEANSGSSEDTSNEDEGQPLEGEVLVRQAMQMPVLACTGSVSTNSKSKRQASGAARVKMKMASMLERDTDAAMPILTYAVAHVTLPHEDTTTTSGSSSLAIDSSSLAAVRDYSQRRGTFGTNGAAAAGCDLEGCDAEDTSSDDSRKVGPDERERTIRSAAQQLHAHSSQEADWCDWRSSNGTAEAVSAGGDRPQSAGGRETEVGSMGSEAEGPNSSIAGGREDASMVGHTTDCRESHRCEQTALSLPQAALEGRRDARRAHKRDQCSIDGDATGRAADEAATGSCRQGPGVILRWAERDGSSREAGARDSERRHRQPLQADGQGRTVGTSIDGPISSARRGDDRVVSGATRLQPRRGESSVNQPAVPRLVGDGSGKQVKGRARRTLPGENRQTTQRHSQQESRKQVRGEEGRGREAEEDGIQHVAISMELAAQVGNQRVSTVLLGGERQVGTAEEPRVHGTTRQPSHVPLLQVQSSIGQARNIPCAEGNRHMDEPTELGQERMPKDRMAHGSPREDRSEEGAQSEGARARPLPSQEMGATGAAAGAPTSSSVTKKRKPTGRARLEHAAYTRKRLRAEHKKMNRYWQLKSEPYNFTPDELNLIMSFYPADPRLQSTDNAECMELFKSAFKQQ